MIKKRLIVKIMKNIIYLIAIAVLSNKIYINVFGDYYINFGYEMISDFKTQNLWGIGFFSIILFVCYFIETTIIPSILLHIPSWNLKGLFDKNCLNSYLIKNHKFNPFKELEWNETREIYQELISLPITAILFLISWGSIFAYILIFILIFTCFMFFKLSNSLIEQYKNQKVSQKG